jgi:NADPH:quinone reductase-like Zn-dependent oxidoreductase
LNHAFQVGRDVRNVAVGDLVVPALSGQGTWQRDAVYDSGKVFRIDPDLPIEAAATLQVREYTVLIKP